jgi:threonyl-tRNA synthetase
MPGRLDASFIAEDGSKQVPVMLPYLLISQVNFCSKALFFQFRMNLLGIIVMATGNIQDNNLLRR